MLSNFSHGPCLRIESITLSTAICFYCPLTFPSLLKLEEYTKLLLWPMLSSQEYQLVAVLCYYFQLSSPLKMEECIKLLSWPMPLSREYYLSYCPFVYCPALLFPSSSLFLNWKNVSNFFHGPCLWVESITSLLPCVTISNYPLLLNWKNVSNFFHGPCLWVESIN